MKNKLIDRLSMIQDVLNGIKKDKGKIMLFRGALLKHNNSAGEDDIYILARVSENEHTLISLENGNRWANNFKMDYVEGISFKDVVGRLDDWEIITVGR